MVAVEDMVERLTRVKTEIYVIQGLYSPLKLVRINMYGII